MEEKTNVIHINNFEEFKYIISATKKPIIIKFSAVWCGPCQKLKPFYDTLSLKFTDCCFLSVDIDEFEHLDDYWEIDSVPIVAFYKNGKCVDSVVAPQQDEIIKGINMLLH